jgi:hypothetical protein
MKAIVLTCDRYRAVTDHMISRYAKLWPDHPFRFRVPHQELGPTGAAGTVDYRKSPPGIKATVLALVEDLDGDEMVYWCIDDKYPVKLDVPRVEGMLRWLAGESAAMVSGLLFCRCRNMLDSRFLTGQAIVDDAKNVYLERTGYAQIWLHQFLRVSVLRHLFESFPDAIPAAKAMDRLKNRVRKPPSHRIFVARENAAVFGESTSQGVLTQNCHRSILENGLALPDWCSSTTNKEVLMGELDG